MSETGNEEQAEQPAKRERYTLPQMLKKQQLGQLDDLTDEETQELLRYTAFRANVDAEIAAYNRISELEQAQMKELADLRAEFTDRIGELERAATVANFHDQLEKLREGIGQ